MKQRALNQCMKVSGDPYGYLKEWKGNNNKKIISCFAMNIPEEIIHAAGLLPVIAWRSNESVSIGHSHVASFNCGLTRSFIDDVLKEKLNFLDGVVINRMCLQAQGIPFILEQNTKWANIIYMSLPALYGSDCIRDFFKSELDRLIIAMEKCSGNKITTGKIVNSIEIYNHNRKLLSDIYEIRRKNIGIISAREMLSIVHSSMIMPKEENNKLLLEVIEELNLKVAEGNHKSGIPVVIYGSLCQTPHPELLDLIENTGMVVVDDDIFIGSRYFVNSLDISDDPIESMANRYLSHIPPCPTKGDYKSNWSTYISDIMNKNKAKAVITLMIRYCPPHMCAYPDDQINFEKKGIPEIMLEVEHEIISLEQVRTRLQSFVETIGGI